MIAQRTHSQKNAQNMCVYKNRKNQCWQKLKNIRKRSIETHSIESRLSRPIDLWFPRRLRSSSSSSFHVHVRGNLSQQPNALFLSNRQSTTFFFPSTKCEERYVDIDTFYEAFLSSRAHSSNAKSSWLVISVGWLALSRELKQKRKRNISIWNIFYVSCFEIDSNFI